MENTFIDLSTNNGFYEDSVLNDVTTSVRLYAKLRGDPSGSPDKAGYTNNFYKIASTPLVTPVSMNTTMQWVQGGTLLDAFIGGVKQGVGNVLSSVGQIATELQQAKGVLTGKGMFNQAALNDFLKKVRYKVVSASSGYKNYDGSDTNLNVPPVEFYFVARDFNASHLQDAWRVLTYVLPQLKQPSTDKETADPRYANSKDGNDFKERFLAEFPPNNYVNPAMGFNTDWLEGTFALSWGGIQIKNLVVRDCSIDASTTKVLYEDANSGRAVVDDFYTSSSSKVQSSSDVPYMIRMTLSFELAYRVTIRDWRTIMFSGLDSTFVRGMMNRSDIDSPPDPGSATGPSTEFIDKYPDVVNVTKRD